MAHPDIDRLLNVLISIAKQTLEAKGEFHPFSAALDSSAMPTAMPASEGDHRTVEAVIEQLVLSLQSRAAKGEITTAGVCLDAWVVPPSTGEKTDAIELRLEHASGQAVRVFLPYSKDASGMMQYGELLATPWEPAIFGSPTSDGAEGAN